MNGYPGRRVYALDWRGCTVNAFFVTAMVGGAAAFLLIDLLYWR